MKEKLPRAKKITKFDKLMAATIQDSSHLSSADIFRHRAIMRAEMQAAEEEVTELIARLAEARDRRACASAMFDGLGMVIAAR